MEMDQYFAAIVVALIAAISGIVVAIVQRDKRKVAEGTATHAQVAAVKAEAVADSVTAAESVVADIASQSLGLINQWLEEEKATTAELRNSLSWAVKENTTLLKQLDERDHRIAELEREVAHLRGQLDAATSRKLEVL